MSSTKNLTIKSINFAVPALPLSKKASINQSSTNQSAPGTQSASPIQSMNKKTQFSALKTASMLNNSVSVSLFASTILISVLFSLIY